MDRVKRIWYLSPMRAAKVQASLRIRAVSPEPPLLAHTSSESRGSFRQKARSPAPLNGWACAVKTCHDGMLEDTNSLDAAHMSLVYLNPLNLVQVLRIQGTRCTNLIRLDLLRVKYTKSWTASRTYLNPEITICIMKFSTRSPALGIGINFTSLKYICFYNSVLITCTASDFCLNLLNTSVVSNKFFKINLPKWLTV